MAIYLVATNYWIVPQPRTEMGARVMTTNNIGRELGQSRPELTEDELNHVSGGIEWTYTKQKLDGTSAGNVAAKWNVARGAAA